MTDESPTRITDRAYPYEKGVKVAPGGRSIPHPLLGCKLPSNSEHEPDTFLGTFSPSHLKKPKAVKP